MKRLIPLLLLSYLTSPLAQASECLSNTLSANYDLTINDGKHSLKQAIKLTRSNNVVAIERDNHSPTGAITELWHQLPNERLHVIRYFLKHQRGIEYQADEVGNNNLGYDNWSQIQQLISDEKVESMPVIASTGKGCDTLEIRQQQNGLNLITLEWLPKQKLIQKMTTHSANNAQILALTDKNTDPHFAQQQFSALDNLETTDYSDIGDNENDTFLSQMISLGFVKHGASGFYSADGQQIGDVHHH